MRILLLTLLTSLCIFPVAAWGQVGTLTIRVDHPDGLPFSREKLTYDEAMDAMLEFLSSRRGGVFLLEEAGQLMMQVRASGEEVQVTTGEGSQTHSLTTVLDQFELARATGHLAVCKMNLQMLATALKDWAADHNGRYPDKLADLTPRYLKQAVSCSAKQREDTYSSKYRKTVSPDHFVLQCTISHSKAGVGEGVPAYDSSFGLIQTDDELRQHFKP